MTVELAFINQLLADSGFTALAGDRIHLGEAPENDADPHVVLFYQHSEPYPSSGKNGPFRDEYWQFNAFSLSFDTARAVQRAIRACLEDFTGVMGGAGGVTVDRIFFRDEGAETVAGITSARIEFEIWYKE
jgi:hypothetical protein